MDSQAIFLKATKLVEKSGTHDPMRIAKENGIVVFFNDNYKDLLGWYRCQQRHRLIFLNSRLDEVWLAMVLAHEIGHDQLHRNLAKRGVMKEFQLFRIKDTTEYEANAFGAHLLLDNTSVLELAHNGYDVLQMANALHSDVNLMLVKIQEMVKLGYDLRIPTEADSRFLRRVRT